MTCKNLIEFSKKFEMILVLFSGAWEKMIHEKNLKQKISGEREKMYNFEVPNVLFKGLSCRLNALHGCLGKKILQFFI
jgi:hypothetical protein